MKENVYLIENRDGQRAACMLQVVRAAVVGSMGALAPLF